MDEYLPNEITSRHTFGVENKTVNTDKVVPIIDFSCRNKISK